MFVPFLIFTGWIFAFGPGVNEGGFDAAQSKGVKASLEQAFEEADASTLHGNYGNE